MDNVTRHELLDEVIFGTGGHQAHFWSDGHDWVGTIDGRNDGIGLAIGRLMALIRDVYNEAPMDTLIWDFDQKLMEEVNIRNYVSVTDVEIFIDSLKREVFASLPGLPGTAYGYDTSVLLGAYGAISRQFPTFGTERTIIDRVVEVFAPTAKPRTDDALRAVLNDISQHLHMTEVGEGLSVDADRLQAFSMMVDAVADSADPQDAEFTEHVSQLQNRIWNAAAQRPCM